MIAHTNIQPSGHLIPDTLTGHNETQGDENECNTITCPNTEHDPFSERH
jgi:hypothetical protein